MEEAGGRKRALRRSTQAVQRGRYQEPYALGVQRPAWVHPDPVFDPGAARWASFPTIPLDQRGPGDEYVEARDRGELDAWLREQNPSPEHFSDDEEKEEDERLESVREAKGEDEGEGLSTNMDWGSPEPGEVEPIAWAHLGHGAQWVLLEVLCDSKTFASATRALGLTTPEVIDFVVVYIQYHRQIQEWAETCDQMSASELLDLIHGQGPSRNGVNVLHQPDLPTHTIKPDEYKKACQYLRQTGLGEHIRGLGKCRGISEGFLQIPIEREILASCIAILENGKNGSDVHDIDNTSHNGRQTWHDQYDEKHRELVKRVLQIQAYLPILDLTTGIQASTPSATDPTEQHSTPTPESVSEPHNAGQVYAQNNPMFGENSQYAWVFDNLDMDELYDPTEVHKYRNRPAVSYESFQSAADGAPENTQVQDDDQHEEYPLPDDQALDEAFHEAQDNNLPDALLFPFEGLLSEAEELMPCPFFADPEPTVDHTLISTNPSLPVLQAQDEGQLAPQSASSAVPQPFISYIDEVDPNRKPSDSPAYEYFQSADYKTLLYSNHPDWFVDEMLLPVVRPEVPSIQATAHQSVVQEASQQENNLEANSNVNLSANSDASSKANSKGDANINSNAAANANPSAAPNSNLNMEPSHPTPSTDTSGAPGVSEVSEAPAVSHAPKLFDAPGFSAVANIPQSSTITEPSKVSRVPGSSEASAVSTAKEPRFALKTPVLPAQEEITFYNTPAVVARDSRPRTVIDLTDDSARPTAATPARPMANTPARPAVAPPTRNTNTARTPAMRMDSPEAPSTKSSAKPSRKRAADDSDGDYVPKPKRARPAKKAAAVLPQPQVMGPDGVLIPVKRGRGRPRKYPRPEDIAAAQAAAAANQASVSQAATNQAATNQAATNQAATNQAATNQAVTNQATTDQTAAKQTDTNPAATNQADTNQATAKRSTNQAMAMQTPANSSPVLNAATPPANDPIPSTEPMLPQAAKGAAPSRRRRNKTKTNQSTESSRQASVDQPHMQRIAQYQDRMTPVSRYSNEPSNSYTGSRADVRPTTSYERMPASFITEMRPSGTDLRQSSLPGAYEPLSSYATFPAPEPRAGIHQPTSYERTPHPSSFGTRPSAAEPRQSSTPRAYQPSNSYTAMETASTEYSRRQDEIQERMPTASASRMQSSASALRQSSVPSPYSNPNPFSALETDFTTYGRQPGRQERKPTSSTSTMQPPATDARQLSLPGAYSRPPALTPQPDIEILEPSMPARAPALNRSSFQQSSDTAASNNSSRKVDPKDPGPPRRDKLGRLFPPQYETYEQFWVSVPDGADYALKMVEKGWPSDIAMQLARERIAMNMASWPNSIYSLHYKPTPAPTPFPGVTASIRREIEAEKAAAAQKRKENEQADK
ncbi:hypothetical protein JMJ77_0011685 [Colletotrichum scovillei]|uniref:Uncharacterized protein n=1 Tax=Colletotrichum scovillei TaxID=1209932 RepID=A0A9P7QYD1_9PEZI|nr:hypothetical protein JMJ77_0011685 [Colletotrichum scovillei]KAG7045966.1 hypothetical protein JMJ78_0011037 [Colletotrichum scovillei]KAG7063312.1 hypothetical protein JMJ76_0005780 [Colletotrichum scovillei]